jgi:hypothetical protein
MGYGMGVPINVIVFGWVLILAAKGRRREVALPRWLMIVNLVIFCFQILLLISHRK